MTHRLLVALALVLPSFFLMPSHPVVAAELCFTVTAKCIQGDFLEYWRARGLELGDPGVSERESLALFGYPLSYEFTETVEDGKPYTVQYFERARFERHPENLAPFIVLLGRFGARILATAALPSGAPPPTGRTSPHAGTVYFEVTGHNVGPVFAEYWQLNGGLSVFGYPLSEEFPERLEDGQVYAVQYFERARFEAHPEQAGTPYFVQLGQFGRRILAGGPAPPPTPSPASYFGTCDP